MTTFYLDPEGGNDANDGTTFANRWLTVSLGATATRLGPGDTIRVMASPDAQSIGSATWTNNSNTVTLAAALTEVIDNCDTAWTAATNATIVLDGWCMEGTKSNRVDQAAGFTTGKLCYKTLPSTLNLSSYQQVSLWVKTNSYAAPAGVFQVVLCSDSTGDTPVNTLTINETIGDTWLPVVLDNGGALGSSINSVAIYATVDYGTAKYLYFDHIIACKASSSADALTLRDVIAPGSDGPFFTIRSISGTSVFVGPIASTGTASLFVKYYGTTQTVTSYRRRPMRIPDAGWTVNEAGTAAAPVTYSGGWNRTDMSTQTGETWVMCISTGSAVLSLGSRSYNHVENIFTVFGGYSFFMNGSGSSYVFSSVGGIGAANGFMDGSASNVELNDVKHIGCGNGFLSGGGSNRYGSIRTMYGPSGVGTAISGTGNTSYSHNYTIDQISGYQYGIRLDRMNKVSISNCVFSNNSIDVSSEGSGELVLNNCTATPSVSSGSAPVYSNKHNQTAGSHQVTFATGTIVSATDQRNTASGLSWKFRPTSTSVTSYAPLRLSVAKIACASGVAKSVTIRVRRNSTNIKGALRILGGQIAGVPDTVSVACEPAVDTWVESSALSFTPTEDGVVEIVFDVWDGVGTTNNYWIDDLAIS